MSFADGFDVVSRWVHYFDGMDAQAAAQHEADHSTRRMAKLVAARTLRQLRVRAGLSQEQLAAHFNVSVPDLVTIEIGEGDCLETFRISEGVRKLVEGFKQPVLLSADS